MTLPLLITGCPRSGSQWVANILREVGLNIGHESLYPDGMVAPMAFALDSSSPWLAWDGAVEPLHRDDFSQIVWLVRHPRATIRSLMDWKVNDRQLEFFDCLGIPARLRTERPLEWAAEVWLCAMDQGYGYRYMRLEDLIRGIWPYPIRRAVYEREGALGVAALLQLTRERAPSNAGPRKAPMPSGDDVRRIFTSAFCFNAYDLDGDPYDVPPPKELEL